MKPLIVLVPLFVLTACGPERETTKPTIGPVTESVHANGIVKATGQYMVYPTITGTVTALLVREGDTIKAGTPLLRIDDRGSSLLAQGALAQVRSLELSTQENGPLLTQLKQAILQAQEKLSADSVSYLRQRALWEQQIGSRSELDQREQAYTTSRSARVRAVQALDVTRDRLHRELELAHGNAAITTAGNDDRVPRSMIDGVVYDLRIAPGQLATPGKPVALIGSGTDLYVELKVNGRDSALVKPGRLVHISLATDDDRTFTAEITGIVPNTDDGARNFMAVARFQEKPSRLYPNMMVEADIVLNEKQRALTIPAGYLMSGDRVLTGEHDTIAVKIGVRDQGRVEVVAGIDSTTVLYKP